MYLYLVSATRVAVDNGIGRFLIDDCIIGINNKLGDYSWLTKMFKTVV